MVILCIIGAVFVVFPSLANDTAKVFGVGRGADLILYFFIVLMLGIALNLHLKLRSIQDTITDLGRAIALMNHQKPHK
jgi:hypothetical protein